MKPSLLLPGIVFFFVFCLSEVQGASDAQDDRPLRNADDFRRYMSELSNWGRWGKEDQLGALNLVTAQKRRDSLALVKEGVSVSLARDVEKEKAEDNGSPFVHVMDRTGTNNTGFSCADTFKVSYHGMAHTHIDSLCHMFYEGKMYNGFPQTDVTSAGAQKLGIQNLKKGIITRAVLIDLPWLRGVQYLEPGTPIYPADLDLWEKKTGIKVEAGDVV
ncbi:MAG: Cyclase, partial [Verrucomicrobiales bacterium]|nr:Cyclase [Verrucomicrobiales bacterium]